MYCTVLCCIVYSTVLFCTVLFCTSIQVGEIPVHPGHISTPSFRYSVIGSIKSTVNAINPTIIYCSTAKLSLFSSSSLIVNITFCYCTLHKFFFLNLKNSVLDLLYLFLQSSFGGLSACGLFKPFKKLKRGNCTDTTSYYKTSYCKVQNVLRYKTS